MMSLVYLAVGLFALAVVAVAERAWELHRRRVRIQRFKENHR